MKDTFSGWFLGYICAMLMVTLLLWVFGDQTSIYRRGYEAGQQNSCRSQK